MEIHEVHGYDTCEQVEDTNKRAWVTVETLNNENKILAAQIQMLTNKVTYRERTIDSLKSAEEYADKVNTFMDELDNKYSDALTKIQDMTAAATFLPAAEDAIRETWRNTSGKTRGPVPSELRDYILSEEQAARISASIQSAFQSALSAEVKEYLNG